jgi:hypothetical protein
LKRAPRTNNERFVADVPAFEFFIEPFEAGVPFRLLGMGGLHLLAFFAAFFVTALAQGAPGAGLMDVVGAGEFIAVFAGDSAAFAQNLLAFDAITHRTPDVANLAIHWSASFLSG